MGHGHDDHAHAKTTSSSNGPAELPPVPSVRSISPAREDFDRPWPGSLIVWPFVWTAVLMLFVAAACSWGHPIGSYDAEEAHAASPERGHDGAAPKGSEGPAMGELPAMDAPHGK